MNRLRRRKARGHLGAGHAFDARVDCGGDVERPGERFGALGHVMRVASSENFDVQIHGCADRNGPQNSSTSWNEKLPPIASTGEGGS